MPKQAVPGTIIIKPQVVFSLALNAARATYGVVAIASRYTGYDTTKRDPRRGLEVTLTERDGATHVEVEVHIIAEYGVRIPSVVSSLQHQIAYAVESATGFAVDEVRVRVASLRVTNSV